MAASHQRAAAIPAGVYWDQDLQLFRDAGGGSVRAGSFQAKWHAHRAEFPQSGKSARGIQLMAEFGKVAEAHQPERMVSDERLAELDRDNAEAAAYDRETATDIVGAVERAADAPVKDHNPKTAAGRAKPAMEFVPPVAIMHLAEVMRGGAAKYGAFNWRDASVSETTYYSAAHRHLAAWFDGQEVDPESGQQHLAHVMACCAIILDAGSCGALHHDRPKPGASAEVMAFLASMRRD